jgi:hypothetical protein
MRRHHSVLTAGWKPSYAWARHGNGSDCERLDVDFAFGGHPPALPYLANNLIMTASTSVNTPHTVIVGRVHRETGDTAVHLRTPNTACDFLICLRTGEWSAGAPP